MERWRNGIDRQPPRRCLDYPSFSSTLLDAIYRSLDEANDSGETKEQRPSGAHDRVSAMKLNATCFPDSKRSTAPLNNTAATHPRRDASLTSTDAESFSSPHSARLRPIRTTPVVRSGRFRPPSGPDPKISFGIEEKSAKNDSIRSRLRDLGNVRSPSSPGARLANFLNSLFSAKSKVSSESACSTASSHSRSCLSKTPATQKRSVRFCPVTVIVGEDFRPRGEKWVYGGNLSAEAAPPAVRSSKVEEEEDDLFELKNLAVIGRYRNELPVYKTTHLGKYSGVSPGLIL